MHSNAETRTGGSRRSTRSTASWPRWLVVLLPLLAGDRRLDPRRVRPAGRHPPAPGRPAGTPFRMLKFGRWCRTRSRRPAASSLGDDPFGVVQDDPDHAERLPRRYSLDELPQLWNVVRGEMSLVGPRPDLVEQAADYTAADSRRLAARPGITGWSQIQGRDEITWPERFEHDAWYVENRSLALDAKILLETMRQLPARAEPVEDRMNIERACGKSGGRPRALTLREVGRTPGTASSTGSGLPRTPTCAAASSRPPASWTPGGRPCSTTAETSSSPAASARSRAPDRLDVITPYGYGGPVSAGRIPRRLLGGVRGLVRRAACRLDLRPLPSALREPPRGRRARAARAPGGHGRVADRRRGRPAGTSTATIAVASARPSAARGRRPPGPDAPRRVRGSLRGRHAGARRGLLHLFPQEYWETLVAGLGERLVQLDGLLDGEVVASTLCLVSPPWLHYHLGAALEAGRSVGASPPAPPGGAMGSRPRLRGLPPRRRGRRRAGLALGVQAPLRAGGRS